MRQRYKLPPIAALKAFESAARCNSFSRAAEELNTSQPAISRHIKSLESSLGAPLFTRDGKRPQLTEAGQGFFHSVTAGLNALQEGVDKVRAQGRRRTLTIGCSYDIAHLYLMPRFAAIEAAVGKSCEVRLLTSEYELQEAMGEAAADVHLMYRQSRLTRMSNTLLMRETVFPVSSPEFYDANRAVIEAGPSEDWLNLPLLEMSKPNQGWTSWRQLFQRHEIIPERPPAFRGFSSYVYMLEAATAGQGAALGWTGQVERYLDAGTLVRWPAPIMTSESGLYLIRPRARTPDHPACLAEAALLAMDISKDAARI